MKTSSRNRPMLGRRHNNISLALCFFCLITILIPMCHATASNPCPIRLVSIDASCSSSEKDSSSRRHPDVVCNYESYDGGENRLILHNDGLKYISSLPPPLYVVPAMGVYRGGKSLLLNRAMNLTAPYHHGFGVGHSQKTHTRGIDVCGEVMMEEGGQRGTILWMDTEGLWSSEDARGSHGPKLFSLALLLSSAVLLNQVKVLNDSFFDFFAEQQQVARVLKRGLQERGLPEEDFLSTNLSVTWVLQQPIRFGSSVGYDGRGDNDGANRLESFFEKPGDALRNRVAQDFEHSLHVVPMASHDARLWGKLDEVPDSELLPEYIESTKRLREDILEKLEKETVMSLRPSTLVSHLKLFIDLVNTKSFTTSLAVEAFEEDEIARLCEQFRMESQKDSDSLPTNWRNLRSYFHDARAVIAPQAHSLKYNYQLNDDWDNRLETCLEEVEAEMKIANSKAVMSEWYRAVDDASEGASCFFLGNLAKSKEEYKRAYGDDFHEEYQDQAMSYAMKLQRTRLLDCVRLGDLVLPLLTWLLWPFCSLYLQKRSGPGISAMVMHGGIVLIVYFVLQLTNQLPACLCLDYPLLKECPYLLDIVLWLPPSLRWYSVHQVITWVGVVWSARRIVQRMRYLYRTPGDKVSQMLNLELKLNKIIERSKGAVRYTVVCLAMDTADCLDDGNARKASRCLTRALSYISNLSPDDLLQELSVGSKVQKYVRKVIWTKARLPSKRGNIPVEVIEKGDTLVDVANKGNIEALIMEMCDIFQDLSKIQNDFPQSPLSRQGRNHTKIHKIPSS